MQHAPIELGRFTSEADGDCYRCGNVYEIHAYAAFHDGQWTCPDCADAISPGMGDIIRGLDLVFNGVTLDLFTRRVLVGDLDEVTGSLRSLANLIDDIATSRAHLALSVQIVEGLAPDEEGQLIGVEIHRQINQPSKETAQ